MNSVSVLFSVLLFLVANISKKQSSSETVTFPMYSDEVQIVSSVLKNDSTKLVSTTDGDPLFFTRDVFTEACETGICYPIQLTLFWDYAGSFLGFSVPDNKPLTKAGHKEFSELDYFQLFTLLNHPDSKIAKYTKKDLVKVNREKHEVTDAESGATVNVANETLVRGAAFTCLTLWNIVNQHTENLVPENFGRTTPESNSGENMDTKLSGLKNLSASELALLMKQLHQAKLLRKLKTQMQLVNQLDELSALHCLLISNYLNREKYLYPEAYAVLKANKNIADCFSAMIHF